MSDKKENKVMAIDREKEFETLEEMKGVLKNLFERHKCISFEHNEKATIGATKAYAAVLEAQMKLQAGKKFN